MMLTQENITTVIQDLAQFINDTVSSPVDHTRENLNEIATILTIIADHVENQTIVDDMVRRTQHNMHTAYVKFRLCFFFFFF